MPEYDDILKKVITKEKSHIETVILCFDMAFLYLKTIYGL